MSGITTGVGIFSGIDTASLIDQLIAIESRPKILMQQRIFQLQRTQSSYLDINSRLGALQSATAAFRKLKIFDSMIATSADDTVLSATASVGAQAGNYSFIVAQLVTTRQMLSRGFADTDTTAIGATEFVVESWAGRLDRDTELSELNGGNGIERGKFNITVGSTVTKIDISKAATVEDVLRAINDAGTGVTMTVVEGHFELSSASTFSISDLTGSETAQTLGIAGGSATIGSFETITGSRVSFISEFTSLGALNDGNGVYLSDEINEDRYDILIELGPGGATASINVNIGPVYEWQDHDDDPDTNDKLIEIQKAATTIGAVIERINAAIDDATGGAYGITAEINATGTGIVINDNGNTTMEISISEVTSGSVTGSTAADLGLLAVQGLARDGDRIFAGLNTTLVKNLNGAAGVLGDGLITFTDRSGVGFTTDINGLGTVSEIVAQINADAANAGAGITIALNGPGTGLIVSDGSGGSGNLIIGGGSAGDLGIETDVAGVAEDSVLGSSLQHAYVTSGTLLDSLNGGKGVGVGKFRITDSFGRIKEINISENVKTIAELVQQINGQASSFQLEINARINDSGDGIIIEEAAVGANGTQTLKIEDVEGTVAKRLRIAGEASDVDADNFIDGSYESRITFEPTDTLDDMVKKINDSGAYATVSIINDGTAASPFRLSIAARETGKAGRFSFDTKGFDLGLNIMDEGNDAKAFFGSDDPAKAVLLLSSTNTLDGVLNGVSIDMKRESDTPVELTITSNTEAIETAVQDFVDAFNDVVGRIDELTKYDTETEQRGSLLGDSTVIGLRQQLFNSVLSEIDGFTGTYTRLIDVGIGIGDGGTIKFDSERFRDAMEEDADSVAALFETRTLVNNSGPVEIEPGVFVSGGFQDDEFSALGVVGRIEELVKDYIDSIDGVLTIRKNSLDDQIKAQEERIEAFDIRLEQKREILARKFLAMEKAIASLSTQSAVLGSMSFR